MVATPNAEQGAANERLSDLARGAHVTKAAIASSGGAGLLGSGPESANEGKVLPTGSSHPTQQQGGKIWSSTTAPSGQPMTQRGFPRRR
jgi:hypothetical protein